MFEIQDVGVFLGLDVGKSTHHGHGLTPAGKKVFDTPLPNSEPRLRAVFDKLPRSSAPCWWSWTSPPPAAPSR